MNNSVIRYRTKKVKVMESPIEGWGVFAAKNLKKGEVAFIAKGTLTKFKVNNSKDSAVGPNWLGISNDIWLDPREDSPLTYINHSCEPNLGIRGSVSFVATRAIKKGEELTFDYSIAEEDTLWHLPMKCRCGTSRCRGKIRSVQFLPKETFRLYRASMPKHFQQVYNASISSKAHG